MRFKGGSGRSADEFVLQKRPGDDCQFSSCRSCREQADVRSLRSRKRFGTRLKPTAVRHLKAILAIMESVLLLAPHLHTFVRKL
jgi:hypothetical protein